MAKIVGSLHRVLIRYPNLDLSKLKIVGWGAGQYFRDWFPLIKEQVNIEYTVCPWIGGENKIIHGVNVKSPEDLLKEDPNNTLILLFVNDISERMSELMYGRFSEFNVMRAIEFGFDNIGVIEDLQERVNTIGSISFSKKFLKNPKVGIFIQGLPFEVTPQVLMWNKMRFPAAYQCMTTWEEQSSEILDRCRPWLDKLILVPKPENPGRSKINYTLRSARYGIEHLAEQGVEYAVRCRSDNILAFGCIYKAIEDLFGNGKNKGKIAVDLKAAWKHIPFHFSEKIMLARTRDMLAVWGREEDKVPSNEIKSIINDDSNFQKLGDITTESYIWKGFANQAGYPANSLLDGYNFARDKLIAINSKLDWISLKLLPMFNVSSKTGLSFSESEWNAMLGGDEDFLAEAKKISELDLSIRDYWNRKVH